MGVRNGVSTGGECERMGGGRILLGERNMAEKIGIDFHGVISAAPALFAEFCREIRRRGIKVYIITGGPKKDIIRYLERCQVEYDEVWAILDFYEQQGKARFFDDGSFMVDTELWDKAKAEYCAAEGIRFHIDDSGIYGRYFVTPYCRYDIGAGTCAWNGRTIDFKDAKKAAAEVAALLQAEENSEVHGR